MYKTKIETLEKIEFYLIIEACSLKSCSVKALFSAEAFNLAAKYEKGK